MTVWEASLGAPLFFAFVYPPAGLAAPGAAAAGAGVGVPVELTTGADGAAGVVRAVSACLCGVGKSGKNVLPEWSVLLTIREREAREFQFAPSIRHQWSRRHFAPRAPRSREPEK